MSSTISQMTMHVNFRRKRQRAIQKKVQAGAKQVKVQAGAKQVKVQAGKEGTFPSSENRPNNRSHPSRCYPKTFPRPSSKIWEKLQSWRPLWV